MKSQARVPLLLCLTLAVATVEFSYKLYAHIGKAGCYKDHQESTHNKVNALHGLGKYKPTKGAYCNDKTQTDKTQIALLYMVTDNVFLSSGCSFTIVKIRGGIRLGIPVQSWRFT